MQLALDAGNSGVKFGIFQGSNLISNGKIPNGSSIKSVIHKDYLEQLDLIISCSVFKDIKTINLPNVRHIEINIDSIFPFKINYNSPQTLGIDRVVACAGTFTGINDILIIDAGSCITYDFLDLKKGYIGGAISPGIKMRFKAMNNFTEKLPLISKFENRPSILGKSTTDCMKSGAINGIIYEIQGFIKHFKTVSPNLDIYLTGGDTIFLGDELKSGIFVDQNLVLKGLNSLIKLNED